MRISTKERRRRSNGAGPGGKLFLQAAFVGGKRTHIMSFDMNAP